MAHPGTYLRTYSLILAALMVLLAISVAVTYVHLGPWNLAVSMAISAVKTALVAYYFMHLRQSSRVTWIFAGSGLFFLAIMVALILPDYLTRVGIP